MYHSPQPTLWQQDILLWILPDSLGWPDSKSTSPSKAFLVLWAFLWGECSEDQSTPKMQASFEGCAKGGQQSQGAHQTQNINSAFLWQIMNILEAQSLFHPEGSQCAWHSMLLLALTSSVCGPSRAQSPPTNPTECLR